MSMLVKYIAMLSLLLSVAFYLPSAHAAGVEGVVETLGKNSSVSEYVAKEQIQRVFTAIEEELKAGREVTIRNFGRFYVRERAARKGRNPKTGVAIEIPAKKYPRFASAAYLKETVNSDPTKK